MKYAAGAKRRGSVDRQRIDKLIDTLNSGRLSYILKSGDPHDKTMRFLRESKDEELHNIVLRHRMYFEIKTKDVIDNVG